MNTTVAVVLPEWMVYALVVLVVLQAANAAASMYREWLDIRLTKARAQRPPKPMPTEAQSATEHSPHDESIPISRRL